MNRESGKVAGFRPRTACVRDPLSNPQSFPPSLKVSAHFALLQKFRIGGAPWGEGGPEIRHVSRSWHRAPCALCCEHCLLTVERKGSLGCSLPQSPCLGPPGEAEGLRETQHSCEKFLVCEPPRHRASQSHATRHWLCGHYQTLRKLDTQDAWPWNFAIIK